MNQEDIIRMAREAGFDDYEQDEMLMRFATLVAAAVAEPVQEPVAWVCYGMSSDEKHCVDYEQSDIDAIPVGTMLYTAPPKQWVGLTDEEMNECWGDPLTPLGMKHARMIEAKLKEKNI